MLICFKEYWNNFNLTVILDVVWVIEFFLNKKILQICKLLHITKMISYFPTLLLSKKVDS